MCNLVRKVFLPEETLCIKKVKVLHGLLNYEVFINCLFVCISCWVLLVKSFLCCCKPIVENARTKNEVSLHPHFEIVSNMLLLYIIAVETVLRSGKPIDCPCLANKSGWQRQNLKQQPWKWKEVQLCTCTKNSLSNDMQLEAFSKSIKENCITEFGGYGTWI